MKTKFNPKDVPSWCKWIAVDEGGDCWAFELKPELGCHGVWEEQSRDFNFYKLYVGNPPKNWKDELYTWGY